MPKEQPKSAAAIPRQRPVSCRFCRTRKLRCSRDFPCSNCVSRGIQCEPDQAIESAPSATTILAPDPELLGRIRKLEERVESQESRKGKRVKHYGEGAQSHAGYASGSASSPQIDQLDDDVAWLESIYTGQDQTDKIPSNHVVFRTCSIRQIDDAQPYITHASSVSPTGLKSLRCVWLPLYQEAKVMLEKFIRDIEHIHHVVHCPTLSTVLNDVYTCLNQQGQVKPGAMLLLLSIFASCTHSWVQRDCELGLFDTPGQANDQSPLWLKTMEDVFDIAHRTAHVSIEGIQGLIIAMFVMFNLEGHSRRSKSLYSMATFLARELGLHCLDHPSKAHLADSAEAEMGRRVWWYIVASDWAIAARLHGEAQGIYQCHLRQMMVRKPLNIDDEQVCDGMSLEGQPSSQPTAMSYSLLRIRLSEISRHIVDRNPLIAGRTGIPSYDVVMDIDTEIQQLINDMPPFFAMPKAELSQVYQLDSLRAAKIAHQGYMFFSLLYAQRCRLHFPFISHNFVDSTYAPSRDICLQSARLIIRTESQLEKSELFTATRFKSIGLFLGVFMASVVLLMDLCHQGPSQRQQEQRAEITDAFQILEEARHESEMAAKFLESLMHVLRKHRVSPPNSIEQQLQVNTSSHQQPISNGDIALIDGISSTQPSAESSMVQLSSGMPNGFEANGHGGMDADLENFAMTNDFPSYFNEFAQSFGQGVDWNNILSEFDSSFV